MTLFQMLIFGFYLRNQNKIYFSESGIAFRRTTSDSHHRIRSNFLANQFSLVHSIVRLMSFGVSFPLNGFWRLNLPKSVARCKNEKIGQTWRAFDRNVLTSGVSWWHSAFQLVPFQQKRAPLKIKRSYSIRIRNNALLFIWICCSWPYKD